MSEKIVCKRCICDASIPGIYFDGDGICNYCNTQEAMEKEYPISDQKLNLLCKQIKQSGEGHKYDCVIGVSGGCDSSYLMWKLKQKGLRMIAAHWDNNWNSRIAYENMIKMSQELNIQLIKIDIKKEVYDDLCRSFLLASTSDADIPNDIALTTILYEVAESFDLKYIINGHSFRTEGFAPLGWSYMDGKYIESVQKEFGKYPLKSFPNLEIDKWMKWLTKDKIKRVRPLYYMDYNKEKAKEDLHKEFGWEWYGGHHAENRYTKFVGNYLWPIKFDIDLRYIEYSALVRSGQMDRSMALEKIQEPLVCEDEILAEVLDRLHFTEDEFMKILSLPLKKYTDYETYKPYFKKNRIKFKVMFEQGLIPYTFYLKYTR